MFLMKDEGAFAPQKFEEEIYRTWEKKGYFRAKVNKDKQPFTIVMPPPNVTSKAHIGHALDDTLQDILIRYKRMRGYEALWLPGTDHAAIATEHKIVEKLGREGKTKEGIGRKAFDKEAWDWYEKYGGEIIGQFKKMGFSADWDRYRFTMDEKSTDAVLEAFIRLFEKGYVYRGKRETNWCVHCKSVISDDEVVYSETQGSMWRIKYKFADGSGHIVVATTRPETLYGDTAVAVNPNDERYRGLVGREVLVPIIGRKIPIITDDYVESDFGTGMVKITPAHDPNDYEVGKRHNLKIIEAFSKDGIMSDIAGEKISGLGLSEARSKTVQLLKELGLLLKVEPYTHSVGYCERCKTAIEPMITEQWFVKMSELVKPAIKCVEDGTLKIYPKHFEKNYFHWLKNIRDWCISRQLWTGHRIPIYYCDACENVMSSKTAVKVCTKCGSNLVHQDPDVLDTWFSSALWPVTTLGWPEKTKELEYFYPTTVLVTGFDILTQWVTKMVYMGIECGGDVPFTNCLIHGLVRDAQGRKMSKSLGNGIDPLEIVDKYGADTLRIALIKDMTMGIDTRFSDNKIEDARNFLNKVWNAAKFISIHSQDVTLVEPSKFQKTSVMDWILYETACVTETIFKNLDKFDVGVALSNIVSFTLDKFCDWAVELSKPSIFAGGEEKSHMVSVLTLVFGQILKLLHPFAPFMTEHIAAGLNLFDKQESLMISDFYDLSDFKNLRGGAAETDELVGQISAIRKFKLDAGKRVSDKVVLQTRPSNFVKNHKGEIEKLSCAIIEITESLGSGKSLVTASAEYVLVEDEVDEKDYREKLKTEIERVQFEIDRSSKMLGNPKFIEKAPKELVAAEQEKLSKNTEFMQKLQEKLK